jgi:saccharopine dehydrogenase (NAD+, L-lysine-forming)
MLAERLRGGGHDVVLAGRDASRLRPLADRLGACYRVFDLGDQQRVEQGLADIHIVLNAAGPFLETAAAMIDAAIRTRTHYIDIAGEWPVFASAQSRSRDAAAAGAMLMPGVGFSIVATDCLLAHAIEHVNDAALLRVAISQPAAMSRGTLRSLLSMTSRTVVVRRDGALYHLPVGQLERSFDFGEGLQTSVAVSWPDVITGQQTTGVASIEAYAEAGWASRMLYRGGAIAAGIFDESLVRGSLRLLSVVWPNAPSQAARQRAGHVIVAETVDRWRRTNQFRMRTLDGYTVTVIAAGDIVERVLRDELTPGFQTPAGLYGADLITGLGCASFDTPMTSCTSISERGAV